MFELCVFAGTTEGRRLVALLRDQPVRVLACVATEYGQALIPAGGNIEISAGRMDEADMRALLAARRFDAVIDATHPYAEQASRNIAGACAASGTRYLRLNRDGGDLPGSAIRVDSIQAAADFLAKHPGNALLTTGGKALAPYAGVEGFRERFYARVLPLASSLAACEAAGFPPSHVIAMQGPFSAELNAAMLRSVHAKYLVTKASGDSGGFREKLEAAEAAGARCVVVGPPPQAEGMGFAEAVKWLEEHFGLRFPREISVVGIGMGSRDGLTLAADAALSECDCVIGAARMLEAVSGYGKPAFEAVAPGDILNTIEAHPEFPRVAVVMSGDTGFYSGAKKLLPLLEGRRVRVFPGISALQALCARLRVSWDDVAVVSLHGREASVAPLLRRRGRVFALTDGKDALRRLCADLCAAGLGNARLSVGQRLSYPDEAILRGTAEGLRDADCAPLSAVLIEYDGERAPLPVGLPDDAFERQAGADGRTVPMTKSEVRAVSISKLRLTRDARVWDVGAGTGSVSVEAALLCPEGRVYAVERREDAAALIARNAARFGLRNLKVVQGMAPEALETLPAPTHVFVGGSAGGMGEIIALALERNPGARIVVNAVTLESLAELTRLAEEKGLDCGIVQLNIARSGALGRYHSLQSLNPVWIAAMRRGGEGDGNEG